MMQYIYGALVIIVLGAGFYVNGLMNDSYELDRVKTTHYEVKKQHNSEANTGKRVIEVFQHQEQAIQKVKEEIVKNEKISKDNGDDSYVIVASDRVQSKGNPREATTVQRANQVSRTQEGQCQDIPLLLHFCPQGEQSSTVYRLRHGERPSGNN
jgi:hypothetical protein